MTLPRRAPLLPISGSSTLWSRPRLLPSSPPRAESTAATRARWPTSPNAAQLARELRAQGYRGPDQTVGRYLAELRRTRPRSTPVQARAGGGSPMTPSPRATARLLGQVNRLKLVNRSMYGRSGFALLRKRVLRAAA